MTELIRTVVPPPLPTDDDLRARLERFEKTVALCLCVVPFIFSAQCLFASLSAPVFAAMFADFGSKLPGSTSLVVVTWRLWAALGIGVPISTIIVARRARATVSVIYSTIAGLVMFAIAQGISLSLFIPIFQLGAVASGAK